MKASVGRKSAAQLKILVIRADRIGDVILSTPVFQAIKLYYPKSHLTVFVREQVAPLLKGLPYVDEILIYDPEKKHKGIAGFRLLVAQIRRREFKIAVTLQVQFILALALFLGGIRFRVGPLSKWYSWLFFNRGVRQRRSHVEMHEADYNLQLLRRLGMRFPTRQVPTQVAIPDLEKERAAQWLVSKGFSLKAQIVCVHPGMGGSALNWPEEHYVKLIHSLLEEGRQVLLTSGPQDQDWVQRILLLLDPLIRPLNGKFAVHQENEGISYLGGLFSLCSVVVAPSTGPLHLAVALGIPTLSFYPPIRVQSAVRWGPYAQDDSKAAVLVPEVYCGEDFRCRGSLCNYYPCMRTIAPVQALEEIRKHLNVVSP